MRVTRQVIRCLGLRLISLASILLKDEIVFFLGEKVWPHQQKLFSRCHNLWRPTFVDTEKYQWQNVKRLWHHFFVRNRFFFCSVFLFCSNSVTLKKGSVCFAVFAEMERILETVFMKNIKSINSYHIYFNKVKI